MWHFTFEVIFPRIIMFLNSVCYQFCKFGFYVPSSVFLLMFIALFKRHVCNNDGVLCLHKWLGAPSIYLFCGKAVCNLLHIAFIVMVVLHISISMLYSKLCIPLVNMIKEGCENKYASLIFLIFYSTNITNLNFHWRLRIYNGREIVLCV